MSDLPDFTAMTDAEKARFIFERTAISESDVEPTLITEVVAAELEKAIPLFAWATERAFSEQQAEDFREVRTACIAISQTLIIDPHRVMEEIDGQPECYLAAIPLLERIVRIFRTWEMEKAHRELYDHICQKLEFYAYVLKDNPENTIDFE